MTAAPTTVAFTARPYERNEANHAHSPPMRIRSLSRLALITIALASATMGAWCHRRKPTGTHPHAGQSHAANAAVAVREGPPTVRLYYLVDLDGYFEPCGCNTRPLGGIDRLAHFIERERSNAPHHLFVAVGDLLFRDPAMEERMVYQETRKAESLVQILDRIGLTAFAPGPSDYARGASEYARITAGQQAVRLGANVSIDDPAGGSIRADASVSPVSYRPWLVREIGGVRVGLVGVCDFRPSADQPAPAGAPSTTNPVEAARSAVEATKREGARVVVVLASVPRRDAVSIARNVSGVDFVIVARDESHTPPPPERVRNAYLLSVPNQGKFVGVLDLYLRDGSSGFADASPATADAHRASLDRRIQELRERLQSWEHDPTIDQSAVAHQRARLAQIERERAAADAPPTPPASGNYFRARAVEIAPEMPRSHDIEQQIATYFRAINEHNREAYANLAPRPAPRGQPSYVGDEECRSCHEPAFAIWERTAHSRAYWTLEVLHKNYNLSCVGCHITGYQQPGGSEVVQNQHLRNVQCESCHGPGSRHISAQGANNLRATIIRNPPQTFCAQQCHTPEHSDHFNYEQYLPRILGPGHGYPEEATDAGGVRLSDPVLFNGQNSDASVLAH